jgi:hypothetical protein
MPIGTKPKHAEKEERASKGYQKLNGSERPRSSAAKLLGPLDTRKPFP